MKGKGKNVCDKGVQCNYMDIHFQIKKVYINIGTNAPFSSSNG